MGKKTADKASAKAVKKAKTAAKSDRSQKKKSKSMKSKNQADSDSEGEDLESILDKVLLSILTHKADLIFTGSRSKKNGKHLIPSQTSPRVPQAGEHSLL